MVALGWGRWAARRENGHPSQQAPYCAVVPGVAPSREFFTWPQFATAAVNPVGSPSAGPEEAFWRATEEASCMHANDG